MVNYIILFRLRVLGHVMQNVHHVIVYHLGFRAAFRAASVPRPFAARDA